MGRTSPKRKKNQEDYLWDTETIFDKQESTGKRNINTWNVAPITVADFSPTPIALRRA